MRQFLFIAKLIGALFCTLYAIGEEDIPIKRKCGFESPSLEQTMEFQQKLEQMVHQSNSMANRIAVDYSIPVIVHVVYWDDDQNLSQAQIYSQFDALNEDYAGIGYNVENCPNPFKPLVANTNITFCKAIKSPTGALLPEPGIERINAKTAGFKNPGTSGWSTNYVTSKIKTETTWDARKYLNVWVLPLNKSYLGYSSFPGDPLSESGVVVGYEYFGTFGTVSHPFNKGRTLTHEIGHWLGLFHISNDRECGNDFCDDTPPQKGNSEDGSGLHYGCPTFPFQVDACGVGKSPYGEMFMNFMDYTDDVCMSMFTNDQSTRMHNSLANYYTSVVAAASTLCDVSSWVLTANFKVSDSIICSGEDVFFLNTSSGNLDSVRWNISGGTPYTSNSIASVSSVFNTAGTYTATLTIYRFGDSASIQKTIQVLQSPPTPSISLSQDTLYSDVDVSGASYDWFISGIHTATTSVPYYSTASSGIYTLRIRHNSCLSSMSEPFVLTSLKKNYNSPIDFSVTPNPNNGNFLVTINAKSIKNYQLRLHTITGQVLLDELINVHEGKNLKSINFPKIEKGLYLLSITGDDVNSTQSIVIQ